MTRPRYTKPVPARIYMITDYALKKINNPHMRRVLMDALGVTEFTIARYIQKKSDMLLKKQALDAIKEELNLTEEEIYTVKETKANGL